VLRLQAGQYALNKGERGIVGAVFDEHQRLSPRVDSWAVEGVAGYDVDVLGEVFLKCCNLRCLARGLAADNGSELRSWTLLEYVTVKQISPYKVQMSSQRRQCSSPRHCR
jgi:hypothetical protein